MRHTACRRALLDGDLVPEVAEHLDACDRCAAFARDLGQVSEYAQELTPPPAPDGLADRVVTHVQRSAAAGAAGHAVADLDLAREARAERTVDRLLHGPRRGPLLSSVAVAAVMLLLVGVLAALPGVRPGGDDELDPLLTAADHTRDTGSARVRLHGTTSMTVTPPDSTVHAPRIEVFDEIPEFEPPSFDPPPPPDLEGVPEESREQMLDDYQRMIDELEAQQEQFAEEQQRRLEAFREDARRSVEAIETPDEFSFEMVITGEGIVVFPDGLEIDGQLVITDAEPPLGGDVTSALGVIVADGTTFVQGSGGPWFEVGAATGPLGPVLADADGVATMLRGADGEADDLGEEEIGNERVRHLRYPLTSALVAPPDADVAATVDVWVGTDDDVVRRLEAATTVDHATNGFSARMESRMTLELFDFGADVSVEAPNAAGRASSPLGPIAVLDPFDPGFGSSFHFGLADLPQPRQIDPGDFGFDMPAIEPLDIEDFDADFGSPEFEFESEFESEFEAGTDPGTEPGTEPGTG